MLAVHKVTKHAAVKALRTTFVKEVRRSGQSPDNAPTITPIDAGFAKLHIANVAIADDLN